MCTHRLQYVQVGQLCLDRAPLSVTFSEVLPAPALEELQPKESRICHTIFARSHSGLKVSCFLPSSNGFGFHQATLLCSRHNQVTNMPHETRQNTICLSELPHNKRILKISLCPNIVTVITLQMFKGFAQAKVIHQGTTTINILSFSSGLLLKGHRKSCKIKV